MSTEQAKEDLIFSRQAVILVGVAVTVALIIYYGQKHSGEHKQILMSVGDIASMLN